MRRLLALPLAVVVIAGCGGSGGDSEKPASTPKSGGGGGGGGTQTASAGKDLFTAKCGTCHTLADAGTGGTFGPNLDDLKPDKATVLHQIAHGGGGMPPKLYTGEKANTVATYVSSVAGKS